MRVTSQIVADRHDSDVAICCRFCFLWVSLPEKLSNAKTSTNASLLRNRSPHFDAHSEQAVGHHPAA